MIIFTLLVLFQFKHFLADYPLQGRYMLGKFKTGFEWVLPLLAHAGMHALFTFVILVNFTSPIFACKLSVFDAAVHFVVDRIKASPNLLGRWKPDKPYFWWALGADQMCHHLTHYLIIYWVTK